jgi:hypothetical protein
MKAEGYPWRPAAIYNAGHVFCISEHGPLFILRG